MPHNDLLKEFEQLVRSAPKAEPLMQHVAEQIHAHIPRYNWVGFYLLDKKDPSTLVLGPHAGSFTPNPRISLTQGLCGAAAATGRVVVADDVAGDPRYIQASDLVKSQISVPLMTGGKAIAVMNVESYFLATFKGPEERGFIESCANTVANYLENTALRDLVGV
jgi:L-methionine (R)-S-oxide reductase